MTTPVALHDGSTIPQLGFGTFKIPNDEVAEHVAKALEIGYRHIDTAAAYENEQGVGKALASSGLARGDVYLTTKLRNGRHLEAQAALEESLERLGTDYVDLYLVHWPMTTHGTFLDAWRGLVALHEQGLARAIGVSNYLPDQLDRIIEETGVTPVVNQVEVHPTFTNVDVVAANARHGIVTESWSPLGRADDLSLEPVVAIAQRLEATPAQVVIAWHLAKGYVVIPKTVTAARIRENFGGLDVTLTADDIALLDGLDAGHRTGPDPATAG